MLFRSQPLGTKFVTLALDATDRRILAGKTVSPGFLFASLLWHQVLEKWQAYQAAGEFPIPALHLAADEVLESQTEKLALQRKIGSDMRDIWAMQPRFERRNGKNPYKLLEHLRFRAGYDFLLLRCASGEIDKELGDWWTAFYEADDIMRADLVSSAGSGGGAKRKRPPRRGTRHKDGAEGEAHGAGDDESREDADSSAHAEAREAVGDEGDDDFDMPASDDAGAPKRRRRRPRRGKRGGNGNGGESASATTAE